MVNLTADAVMLNRSKIEIIYVLYDHVPNYILS